jgi:hypothetical protein
MSSNLHSSILFVFKLLTPSVIIGLTKATSLRNKTAPILGLGIIDLEPELPAESSQERNNLLEEVSSLEHNKAKIIPFHKNSSDEKILDRTELSSEAPSANFKSDYRPATLGSSALALSREESVLEGIGVQSRRTIEEMQKQKEEAERMMRPTAAEFVITEREKNRDTNRKISESNALGSYQKQSKLKSGNLGSSDVGVLLDKKRF